jgi:hypothetical protein
MQDSQLALDQTKPVVGVLILGAAGELGLDVDVVAMMRTNDVLVEVIVNEIGTC